MLHQACAEATGESSAKAEFAFIRPANLLKRTRFLRLSILAEVMPNSSSGAENRVRVPKWYAFGTAVLTVRGYRVDSLPVFGSPDSGFAGAD